MAALLAGTCLGTPAAYAVDGTWIGGNVGDPSEWVEPNNWSGAAVPDGTATFTLNAAPTSVQSNGLVNIGAVNFSGTSPSYTITNNDIFLVNGSGITNNSGSPQTFEVNASFVFQNNSSASTGPGPVTFNNHSTISFQSFSTAGSASISNFVDVEFNDNSTAGTAALHNNGTLNFNNSATAGSAAINNNLGATLSFGNSASAATATITNDGAMNFNDASNAGSAPINNNLGATLSFGNSASAQDANITNDGGSTFNNVSTAGNSKINNGANGRLDFFDASTAGTSTITNTFGIITFNNSSTGGSATITNSSLVQFNDNSTAGAAIINNTTGATTFAGSSTAESATITSSAGGTLSFIDQSTAGSAKITTDNASQTLFTSNSTGGNAQFITSTGGVVDFSGTTGPAGDKKITAGSIAGTGNYFLGGNQLTVGSNNLTTTVGGAISDGGSSGGTGASLVKVGTGTLILSGVNTYTGGTTISAGAIQVGNNSAVGTGPVTLDGGAFQAGAAGLAFSNAFAINTTGGTIDTQANSLTISGPIQNGNGTTGALNKAGSGTLVLSGTSSYTGATNVNAGTLQAGKANAFAPVSAFAVAGGAALDLNSFNQTIGSLTGAGNVALGTAALTTGGDNTSTAFSGGISGTGGLIKVGTGTFTLSGTNNYSGATTVNAGMLQVNGAIANSATTVNDGAVLSGTGTVGALTVKSGGSFAPGPIGAPGSMTVAGNLAFQSGAIYLVQVNPTTASLANVTGTAALAGSVQAAFAPGSYLVKSYTILHSGGLGGTTFSGVAGNIPANFVASLSYSGTDVLLNLAAQMGNNNNNNPQNIASGGLSQNQKNVANSLNSFFNNGGALPPGFVSVFGLTGTNLGNALTLLSGEVATGAQQSSFELMSEFLGVMMDPFVNGRSGIGAGGGTSAMPFAPEREASLPPEASLAYASVLKAPVYKATPFEPRWNVWGTAYGGYGRTSGDPVVDGSHDLRARAGGFAAGMDYRIWPDTTVGFALAGAGTGWSLANGLGTGRSDAFQAGVYGTTRFGPAYVSAALAYTAYDMSTDRVAPALDHLTARFDPQSVGGRVETGYRYATSFVGITPYAALQAQTLHLPAYSEIDAASGGFGLNYAARNASDTRSELGARFDHVTTFNGMAWTLRGRAAWAHDWVSDPSVVAIFQALPGASFAVNGAAPVKDSALLSAGSELRVSQNWTLGGKFESQLASHTQTYSGMGTARYTW